MDLPEIPHRIPDDMSDEELYEIWQWHCLAGDLVICDDLAELAPGGSDLSMIGITCGYAREASHHEGCVSWFGTEYLTY